MILILNSELKLISSYSETSDWCKSNGYFTDYLHNTNQELVRGFLDKITDVPSLLKIPIQFSLDNQLYCYDSIHAFRLTKENTTNILVCLNNDVLFHQSDLLPDLKEKLESTKREFSEFAYVVSHDLVESLRMVSSFTALIDKEYSEILNSRGKDYIAFAKNGASKMKKMINDLLKYSRVLMDESPFEEVSFKKLIDDLLASKEALIKEEKAEIHTEIENCTLQVKKNQLGNLVSHLLDNALKFKEEGSAAMIEIKGSDRMEFYEFTISDQGLGIPHDFLDRAFLVFQKGDNAEKFEGTGIGLALAKRIVDNHNGCISIETLNKGTKVKVSLPVVPNETYV